MKKELFIEAVKNQTIRRNAYGEIRKGLFTDEVYKVVENFFIELSNAKEMSPYRMCLITDKMKKFIENTAMEDEIK